MKIVKLITVVAVLITSMSSYAQKQETKMVKEVIEAFSKAGDENNVEQLAACLDDNYRVVMNRLFGSNEVSILTREVYLEKIKSKEFGGDTRNLTIENVLINGTNASAKVTFQGKKMTFTSIITLIKNKDDKWKLISDIPTFN